jgi:hypothetical protein
MLILKLYTCGRAAAKATRLFCHSAVELVNLHSRKKRVV